MVQGAEWRKWIQTHYWNGSRLARARRETCSWLLSSNSACYSLCQIMLIAALKGMTFNTSIYCHLIICFFCVCNLFTHHLFHLFFSCPPRTFLPALCRIFLDETAPDNVLEVTARAITYYLDVSAECTRRIVAVDGAIKAICNHLVVVEMTSRTSKDLAEQCIKVSNILISFCLTLRMLLGISCLSLNLVIWHHYTNNTARCENNIKLGRNYIYIIYITYISSLSNATKKLHALKLLVEHRRQNILFNIKSFIIFHIWPCTILASTEIWYMAVWDMSQIHEIS